MSVPYSLLVIKPMSIGRGDGPLILEDILENCPVALRQFRQSVICDNTLLALTKPVGPHLSALDYDKEKIHPPRHIASWICIFTHLDRVTDPTSIIDDYCGPLEQGHRLVNHLRSRYRGSAHSTDTCVHLASPERVSYEANLLFMGLDESII